MLGMDRGMAPVTAAVHATARLGLASGLTGTVREVTHREPRPVVETLRREAAAWRRGTSASGSREESS